MYTLGIDLHKRSSVWVLLNDARDVLHKSTVTTHPLDINIAIQKLPVPAKEVRVVLEPTGGWRWVADIFEQEGMQVHIANPTKVRLIAESKKKFDAGDAQTLADLLRADYLPEAYRAPNEIDTLRMLVRERAYFVRLRTSVKNRIHGALTRKGAHLIPGHPLRKPGLVAIALGDDKEMIELLMLLEELTAHITPLEKRIEKEAKTNPTAKLLMTMQAVGPITAVTVAAEVGDFGRFKSAEALASYAGLVPSQRSSGQSVRFGHITKQGSRLLRSVMVEAALRIRTNHDAQLTDFLDRLKPKCGAKRARVALARKMLTIMWYMVRDNTPYKESIISSHHDTKRDDLVKAF